MRQNILDYHHDNDQDDYYDFNYYLMYLLGTMYININLMLWEDTRFD